jgi:glycosyltransferase involved in cell wall biosynthesis
MKVVIASTAAPFIGGGGTNIVHWLHEALLAHGHESDPFLVPFSSNPSQMPAQMVGLRLMDFTDVADRVVAIRTPSYLVRHPAKVLWFIHHHRPAYDLWDSPFRSLTDDPEGREQRRMIVHADQLAFGEARAIHTNSQIMSDRLAHFNGVVGTVLYPPLPMGVDYRNDDYGDYLLMVARLTRTKRQDLAVEAMAHATSSTKLVLAGQDDGSRYVGDLRRRIVELGLQDRVTLLDRWISDAEKLDLLARCRAVVSVPLDEDSYGYTGLEGAQSGKGVITTTDAGGLLELVSDGRSGLVCAPEPAALGAAFDRLFDEPGLPERLGTGGLDRIAELGIDWTTVIDRLLA